MAFMKSQRSKTHQRARVKTPRALKMQSSFLGRFSPTFAIATLRVVRYSRPRVLPALDFRVSRTVVHTYYLFPPFSFFFFFFLKSLQKTKRFFRSRCFSRGEDDPSGRTRPRNSAASRSARWRNDGGAEEGERCRRRRRQKTTATSSSKRRIIIFIGKSLDDDDDETTTRCLACSGKLTSSVAWRTSPRSEGFGRDGTIRFRSQRAPCERSRDATDAREPRFFTSKKVPLCRRLMTRKRKKEGTAPRSITKRRKIRWSFRANSRRD